MKILLKKFKTVKSTNDTALYLIKKQNLSPIIVTSDTQTRGKGTMGKRWISKKGNLFISILFEIQSKKIDFKQYAILNAYVIKKVISKYISKKVSIKWPNDLLIEKKKVCGILQEVIHLNKKKFLVVGVGINTFLSPNISGYKTSSLKNYSKKKYNNAIILKDIKKTYEKFLDEIKKYQFSYLKRNYSKLKK
jgi:BirA family biotin operon repressor/biotin-[acetyl-CoA-carboxylase] ligase